MSGIGGRHGVHNIWIEQGSCLSTTTSTHKTIRIILLPTISFRARQLRFCHNTPFPAVTGFISTKCGTQCSVVLLFEFYVSKGSNQLRFQSHTEERHTECDYLSIYLASTDRYECSVQRIRNQLGKAQEGQGEKSGWEKSVAIKKICKLISHHSTSESSPHFIRMLMRMLRLMVLPPPILWC